MRDRPQSVRSCPPNEDLSDFRVVPFVLHDLHDLHGKALRVGRPAPRYFPAVNPKGTEPRSNEPWEYCGN